MNNNAIAVIPARGGSKRIKDKNIREFAGQPLISYSIQAALDSQIFSDVLVSTDSDTIKKIALQAGATGIIMRPEALADDHTGTSPVVRHAIQEFEKTGQQVTHVCCIYATAPFLDGPRLKDAYQQFTVEENTYFAFSITTFDFPIQRALRREGKGIVPFDRSKIGCRSQDLESFYHDAGQFYFGTKSAWLNNKPMFSPYSLPIILPRYLVQDIDTEEDWQRAELMYKAYCSQ